MPIDARSSLAATGSDLSASSTASASSTVRLPERRSSPDGLPVTAGSPNTPSTSSRSWKATPEVGAQLVEDRLHVGPVGGGRRAELQRPR